jgi:hypothetical protein
MARSTVIARSESNEAIQKPESVAVDCFAALAMTMVPQGLR